MAIVNSLDVDALTTYYVNFIVDNANEYKNEALSYADVAAREARTTLLAVSELSRDGELNDVTFTGVNDSQFSTLSDLRNEFDSKYHYLFDMLNQKVPYEFNKFINEFMPKPTNFDNIEKFLVDSIFNGSIGLPPEIEKQIWERSRQRIELTNNKQILENRKSMASRGFIEPNGAELYREMILRSEGNKAISADSSQVAIESAKLRIEWVKFAVSEARNYRTLAMESAFKYLANVLSIHDPAFKYASGYVDSYKTFYDTVNAYYNSVNTVNRLKLEKANMIDRRNYDYDKFFVDQVVSQDKQRSDIYLELARSMALQASSALSGINTIVSATTASAYTSAKTVTSAGV